MIRIKGWTNIYHSYAMVNQWQMLSLDKLGMPIQFHEAQKNPRWSQSTSPSGFPPELVKKLEAIKSKNYVGEVESEYRITFPFDLSGNNKQKLFVYGTAEEGKYPIDGNFDKFEFIQKLNGGEFVLITPSDWSRNGFVRSGADPAKIKIVHNGVATSIFKPLPTHERENLRSQLGLGADDFVILNIGAMTKNKGVDLLLTAIWHLRFEIPNLRLLVKDASSLYNLSIGSALAALSEKLRNKVIGDIGDKLIVQSNPLSIQEMSYLYNLSDCYVSPYRAEGFNLPPLEAASCGVPILVTKGGASDEYFHPLIGRQIESEILESTVDEGAHLSPSLESLIEGIRWMYHEKESFNKMEMHSFISKKFNWDLVSSKLKSFIK